jgi:polyhydroxyalkanoate synthesis regulator phasin
VPQPKSSGGSSRGSRKPARRRAASKPAAGRKPTGKGSSSSKPKTAGRSSASKPASRSSASKASKPAARRGSSAKPKARSKPKVRTAPRRAKPAGKRAARPAAATASNAATSADDAMRANLATVRDVLARGVVVTTERVQETVDDAVRRGRMMPQDAEELVASIISVGRQQTQDILADLEQLLGRTRSGAEGALVVSKKARTRASESGDKVLQRVDKARRAAGIGTFPILNYDDLTASQIVDRVTDLTAAQLRKVRDFEKRNANRKSVLDAIARRLSS